MKTYDVTEKLNFEDNPKMKIKDIEVEINSDAKSIIQAVALLDSSDEDITGIITAYELLFSEADRKKIDKLKLKSPDFMTVVRSAISLASGQNPDDEGNE